MMTTYSKYIDPYINKILNDEIEKDGSDFILLPEGD